MVQSEAHSSGYRGFCNKRVGINGNSIPKKSLVLKMILLCSETLFWPLCLALAELTCCLKGFFTWPAI